MDWIKTLSAVAPTLATALGGPLAGGAVKFISSKLLGDESATQEQLADYIQHASPEQLQTIKKLDNDFKVEMERLGVDVFKLEVADRDSARTNHSDHWMPSFLCIMLTLLVAAGCVGLMVLEIPEANKSIVFMLYGQVVTAWTGSVAYWVGTTKSSQSKTKLLKASA